MSDRFICGCCGEPKHSLESRKSKITGMEVLMCRTCIHDGFEPRELIIIGYYNDKLRSKTLKYIKNNLYVGTRITLTEVL